MRFGGAVHHHPLLASFNMRFALTGVPGLASQTTIPASAVHSMQVCLQPPLGNSACWSSCARAVVWIWPWPAQQTHLTTAI